MKKTSNLKQPKCKHCKQPFTKTQPLQVACSYGCAIELAKPIAKKVIEKKWNELDRVYSYINPILSKLHSDKKLWFYVPEIHRCIIDREHFNHLSIFK